MLGYLRAVRPTFGRIPAPALVLMNTLGLNVFIADRRHQRRPGIRRRAAAGRLQPVPLGHRRDLGAAIVAVLLGHYVFKFHPAILFGVCAGVRTTTAALGMIQDAAKSKVPALGYGMPYAIGNTLLTIFGMVIVLLTERGSVKERRQTMDAVTLASVRDAEPLRDQELPGQGRDEDRQGLTGRLPERRTRAIRTGSPPSRARRSSCSANSRSPRASA